MRGCDSTRAASFPDRSGPIRRDSNPMAQCPAATSLEVSKTGRAHADWLNQSPKESRPPGGGPANYAERCQSGQSTDRGEGLCLELWRHRRPVVHCVAGGFNTSPTPRHGCRVAALPNLMQWAVNQSIQQTRTHKLFVSVWKLLNFEQRETPRLAPGDLEDQPFHADSWLVVHISKSVGILVGSPSFVGSSPARNPTEVYATDSML